jgi:lipopolysaccharide/colanic/teichoic acid biosynthesis glycosyltransferase
MSIVGPRPELVEFKSVYQAEIPYYSARWAVKPGLTGYAQITQGYTESIEMVRRKSELDAHYIRNMSWKLDLRVIAKTFTVICVPHADS